MIGSSTSSIVGCKPYVSNHLSQADTEELNDEVQETFIHHNRTYQRFAVNSNTYFAPVDEDETLRLRTQQDVLSMVFDGRLIFPHIQSLRRVLDCGFGTGSWAFQVAWENPNCEHTFCRTISEWKMPLLWEAPSVIKIYRPDPSMRTRAGEGTRGNKVRGIDISPHHHNPNESVDNLYLDIDDLNMPLNFRSNHFDLINSRLVAGGINSHRWTGYLRDMFKCLRAGGWVQLVEIDFNAQSDNGTLTESEFSCLCIRGNDAQELPASALRQWSQMYLQAMEQCKNPRAPRRLGNWLRSTGFTEVDERMIPIPMCGWSDNQRELNIGTANQENVRMLLSSLTLYPFSHYLGMSITEFHVLVAQARAEASNPALKPYFPL
ncbi:Uu.00g018970.m01.CDS01 [Anthostomella pinea]|uniref:Uu.00g018970.m01.CDS01 n=1 Tax=Anthostomella pinea TaxID=933095 RepID=A0AAI8VZ75_9PEZI|nr:Uu.00g018970.m01.CDS01 [Anthostomella pinea]